MRPSRQLPALMSRMVCPRCKRKVLFETHLEEEYPEEDEDEPELTDYLLGIRRFRGTGSSKSRRRRELDFDQRLADSSESRVRMRLGFSAVGFSLRSRNLDC